MPTLPGLSVTATMFLGMDRFVGQSEDGTVVPRSARRVQPWLCAEALLGGALWALWTDGVAELRRRGPLPGKPRAFTEIRPLRGAAYPQASLERLLLASLADHPEPAADALARTLAFTRAQPWCDVVDVVCHELLVAGYPIDGPPRTNGSHPSANAVVDELSARWDGWWARHEGMLVVVARACHDALVARRLGFARQIVEGLSLSARPPDPAEATAGRARPRCPRWPRHL